jgi:hypothetical protein
MREEVLEELRALWLELNGINAQFVLFITAHEKELKNQRENIVLFPNANKRSNKNA